MENQLKFTKEQLQIAINDHISSQTGLNDLLSMVLNGIMHSERSAFLSKDRNTPNKGNGYRNILKSGLGSKLELQIPRDRLGIFRPVILGVLEQQEERIKDLSFTLYSKGLTTRQISDVLEDIYGSSYSKSSVSRISKEFYEVVKKWLDRPLDSFYPLIYIDATHLKVRRDTVSSEAFYLVLGVKEDFTREVLAIVNFPTESASGWQEVLQEIKIRGLKEVELFISDDLKGLDVAIDLEFNTNRQKCIIHFQRSISKQIRVSDRADFCQDIKVIFKPDDEKYSPEMALNNLDNTLSKWEKIYPSLKKVINRGDLSYLFTYLNYDFRIRRMIYTTNWIERLNKSFKRTLKIRNALPTIDAAITLMATVAMEMEEKTYKYPISNLKFEQKYYSR